MYVSSLSISVVKAMGHKGSVWNIFFSVSQTFARCLSLCIYICVYGIRPLNTCIHLARSVSTSLPPFYHSRTFYVFIYPFLALMLLSHSLCRSLTQLLCRAHTVSNTLSRAFSLSISLPPLSPALAIFHARALSHFLYILFYSVCNICVHIHLARSVSVSSYTLCLALSHTLSLLTHILTYLDR